jgi:hypothetical protein
MRVFLRNTKTRLYWAGSSAWAVASGKALDFISVPRAARFAYAEGLPEIEIVLKYDALPDEVIVPMLPEWRDFDRPESAAA